MKKLFIIALSVFAIIAFTNPPIAGAGTSGNSTAINGQIAGLAATGFAGHGRTAGIAVDGALAAGYTSGNAFYGSSAWASQDTQYGYGYFHHDRWGHPNSTHRAGGVVQTYGEGNMSQYSNGNTGDYDTGNFSSGAIVGQGSITGAYGTPNTGFSGMIQATGGIAQANSSSNDDWYWYDNSNARAGFDSYQADGYFMYNQTNRNNFTMHSGYATQEVSGSANGYDYGYYWGNSGATVKAGVIQGGATITHYNTVGNTMYMGAAQITGAKAATSVSSYGNGYGSANATGDQTYSYAQGQQNSHGFQWQTGSSYTHVGSHSGYYDD